jgi:hypothetical protein
MNPPTRTWLLLLIFLLVLLGLNETSPVQASLAIVPAVPQVFASPINAACVLVTPNLCRLHVDPFTIQVATGQHLVAFQLQANNHLLYDFRTDVSNPPGTYSPSGVKLDFAASCGQTYTVNLLARDSGDTSFLNAGLAQGIACPQTLQGSSGSNPIYLPIIRR